ncbi:putative amidohydrolase YtcJ [Sphingomonas sp. BE138]|uniref:amidohydrolase n=1 Tax=Sphingomonas sp. BE138 TaxID=2817845 RepID=UPI0028581592|nr:amidohydrolase family protein [Sphingomonas sp. BE138]MDR6788031.1 putative amidohydrolase YtcJ [Sphingomonas sp. BE138]
MNRRHLTAALGALAGLSVAAAASADALIDNVTGLTLNRDRQVVRFKAMVIDPQGKVVRLIAPDEEPPKRTKKNPGPRYDWRADMKGRVLVPGMIDAHGHVIQLGLAALTLDLSDTRSLEEAKARIAEYARANPDRQWIIGRGWNQEVWKLGRFPTAADLDAVVGDRPVWLARADGHAGWANSAALKLAGVTAATAAPAGGRVEKPLGVLVDRATELVERVVPKVSPKDRTAAFLKAQQILLGFGVTAIADMGTSVDDWMTYRRMGDINALRVRIMSYGLGIDTTVTIGGTGPTPWLYDDRLRLEGVKLYADGALGSRGAWLKADYADAPGQRGLGFLTDDQLQNTMSRAAMDGYQVAVHAIGDRADKQVLDAIAELSETYKGDRRWRIEHAQVVDPVDMAAFGKYHIIASMQPTHQTSDRVMAEARLGAARLAGAYAWRTLLNDGATLAFGSDAPVERPDPWAGWAAAFTRTDENGQPVGGWYPEQAVSREQAWWAYTGGASYAGFAEQKFGILAPGQRADFLLLDRDPLTASAADLRQTKVLETWIGGTKAWERK